MDDAKSWPPNDGAQCLGDTLIEVLEKLPATMRLDNGVRVRTTAEWLLEARDNSPTLLANDDDTAYFCAELVGDLCEVHRCAGPDRNLVLRESPAPQE
jgi:hypothetical protein